MTQPQHWSEGSSQTDSFMRQIMSRFSILVRERQYTFFQQMLKPKASSTVLDVGVTPDTTLLDSNFFETRYPYSSKITAVSVENCQKTFRQRFPKVKFQQIAPNQRLPFRSNHFDIVVSWATVEHVGSRAQQAFFLKELFRVGRCIFVTTPYKYCPYDPHTTWFFLHWLPHRWFRWFCILLHKPFWGETAHLHPLSVKDVRELAVDQKFQVVVHKTWGIPSHLLIIKTT